LLADGVAEGGRGALRVGSRQTQHEEEEGAYATAKVADQNIFSPEQQDTCRYRFRRVVAVFMSREGEQGYQGSVEVRRHSHDGRRKRNIALEK
jgi:hypothetical protein